MRRLLDPYQRAMRQHRAENWIQRNERRQEDKDSKAQALGVILGIGLLLWVCIQLFLPLFAAGR